MDRKLLIRVGEALYGEGWIEAIACDMAVAYRVVERWENGTREIPPIEGELAALCHEKARTLATLANTPPLPMAETSPYASGMRTETLRTTAAERRRRSDQLARLAVELGYR